MHAGQPAWWSPTNITVPWHDMFPCRQAIQHLAQIQDLRPRELCK